MRYSTLLVPSDALGHETGQRGAIRVVPLLILVAVIGILVALPLVLGLTALKIVGLIIGLVLLVAGAGMISQAMRESREARLHSSKLPLTPLAEVEAGALVRITGRVASPASVHAPLSDKEVVYSITRARYQRSGTDSTVHTTLPDRHLGGDLELEEGGHRALIRMRNVELLSKHEKQEVGWKKRRHCSPSDEKLYHALGELYPDLEIFRLIFDLEESTIEGGDPLTVTGKVASIETPGDGTQGRGITITNPDKSRLLLTNLSDDEIREKKNAGRFLFILGLIVLPLGCACHVGSILWLLG